MVNCNTLAFYQMLFCHRLTQTKAGQRPVSLRALRVAETINNQPLPFGEPGLSARRPDSLVARKGFDFTLCPKRYALCDKTLKARVTGGNGREEKSKRNPGHFQEQDFPV